MEILFKPICLVYETLKIKKIDVRGTNGCGCDSCYDTRYIFETKSYFKIGDTPSLDGVK